jgi:hypothetical protein
MKMILHSHTYCYLYINNKNLPNILKQLKHQLKFQFITFKFQEILIFMYET